MTADEEFDLTVRAAQHAIQAAAEALFEKITTTLGEEAAPQQHAIAMMTASAYLSNIAFASADTVFGEHRAREMHEFSEQLAVLLEPEHA